MDPDLLIPALITYRDGQPTPWDGQLDHGHPRLGPHLSGWITARQLQSLTGSERIRPWLGTVLVGDDGAFVYDAEQAAQDLEEVAGVVSLKQGSDVTPAPLDTLDDFELAQLMRMLLNCQDDTTYIAPEFVSQSLRETYPEVLRKSLRGVRMAPL